MLVRFDAHHPNLGKMVQPGDLRALDVSRDSRSDGRKLLLDLRIEKREVDRALAESPGDSRGDENDRPEQG